MNKVSKVFVAYSHDSDKHKKWVKDFSSELRSYGINIILDQWDLNFGEDVTLFIESNIKDSEKVLIVCTNQYIKKANRAEGGVGYERMIITRELIQNAGTNKFIPVIRQSSGKELMPDFMGVRFYADFRDDSKFEVEVEKLANQLRIRTAADKSIEKMSKRNLKKLKQDLLRQGGLFDFNPTYSARHFNTLNRLIQNINQYKKLNIIFDFEVPYVYESNIHRALTGDLFSLPTGSHSAISEFVYKYLNNNFSVEDYKYVQELANMINEATSHEIFDYLSKFKNILDFFEDAMVKSTWISIDFPDGEYDNHTLAVVRSKKQQLSSTLTKYYQ